MAEVITLSSDDEETTVVVPKKRIKLTTLSSTNSQDTKADSCIVIDDDDDDCKVVKIADEPLEEPREISNGKLEPPESSNIECVNDSKPLKNCVEKDELLNTPTENPNISTENLDISTNNLNVSTDTLNLVNNGVNSPEMPATESDTESSDMDFQFFAFLDDCVQAAKDPKHRDLMRSKLPLMRKLHEKSKKLGYDTEEFKEIIRDETQKVRNNPEQSILSFKDMFQWLKSNYKDGQQAKNSTEHNEKIIRKLDKALLKIRSRIRELEEAEIDFDDEENSTFLQLERYMRRASQIYEKLCKYRNENPHSDRVLYYKLDFSESKFSAINIALNRKYRNCKVFPTYYDIDKCIRKCVQEKGLKMTEDELKYEIKNCFEKLGRLIQKKRKTDLYNNQMAYIGSMKDPTLDDPEFNAKIHISRNETVKKLEQVLEKYTRLQEKGVNPEISSESEDSDVVDSGSEAEHDENATENV